ncbi:hypothetical protein H4R33_000954 [Dimargaris cristalligena]|nr:hypothetical protein H4R33_000954 [Dimargaris cristalligena]
MLLSPLHLRHRLPQRVIVRSRAFSVSRVEPVRLASSHFPISVPAGPVPPLVILHGLFGSKQNWQSLGRAMAQRLGCDVYALDLRNHGESPHATPMTLEAMAQDVSYWLKEEGLSSIALLGHSMGGKVAMTMALNHPAAIEQLIVADMAPVAVPLSSTFAGYIRAMQHAEAQNPTSKRMADQLLQADIPELPIRQFLLTNYKPKQPQPGYTCRVPLDVLATALPNLGEFDADQPGAVFPRPTLFIAGSRSDYIKPEYRPTIARLFPRSLVEYIDAGHWGCLSPYV